MWTVIMKLPYTQVKFHPEVKSQTVWVDFESHVNVLLNADFLRNKFVSIEELETGKNGIYFMLETKFNET